MEFQTLKVKADVKEYSMETDSDIKGILEKKSLSKEDLMSLIDIAYELNEAKKKIETILGSAKKAIMENAKENGWTEMDGQKAKARISPSNTSVVSMTPTEFARFLKNIGKIEVFDKIVNIPVTTLKKYVDEHTLIRNGVIQIESEQFGSLTFRKLL